MDTEELCFQRNDRVYVRGNDTRWLTAKIVQRVDSCRYAVKITETTVFSTDNIKPLGTLMTKDLRKRFVPSPDITAYELAIIYRNIIGNGNWNPVIFTKETWNRLPGTITRHFQEQL